MDEAWDDMVLVGIISKPHGLRGEVTIRPETDFPEQRFAVGSTVWALVDGAVQPLTIDRSRVHLGRPLVGFEGIDTLERVEALGHADLKVPEAALVPLGDGEYYWYQLIGAPVEVEGGERVGEVLRVEPTGGAGMLVVSGTHGEVQIPLVPDICTLVTPARIVVRAPEGLLELNAPTGRRREGRHRHHLSRDDQGRPG
jgi:16S rRNA processing protein RimM